MGRVGGGRRGAGQRDEVNAARNDRLPQGVSQGGVIGRVEGGGGQRDEVSARAAMTGPAGVSCS